LGTIAALIGFGACSSNNNNNGGGNATIQLALNPTAATVQAGSTTTVHGTLTRSNYTGSVTITSATTIAGVTASVLSQPNTSDTASVMLSVAASAAAGTDTITVIAAGNGVTQSTATFILTITAAANPMLGLVVTPVTTTLQAGSSTTLTGVLSRGGGFTGSVNVIGTSTGSGLTAAVGTQPGTGDTVQITLTAGATATAGVDTVTIGATGTGVTEATQPIIVTVVAANGQLFQFGAASSSVALNASANVADTLTLTRTGFAGDVTFSAENLPSGVTASFAQPASGNTGVVTFTAGASVAPGTYTVLLRGVGTGVSDVTLPVTVIVNGTGTGGSFTMTSSMPSLSIAASGNQAATITLTRGTGYTGAISFTDTLLTSLGGAAPAGLTVTVTPNPVPTGTTSATVTVSASGAVPAGAYALSLVGSGAGIVNGNQTLIIPITVTAAVGGAVHLDYSACSAANKPVYVAYQDGSGNWTQAVGTGDVYNFNIASAKGGLAVVTQSGANYNTTVEYLAQGELTGMIGGCPTVPTGNDVTGTYAGASVGDQINVALGTAATTTIATSATGNYALSNVASGNQDLIGYLHSAASPGTDDKLIVRRDLNLANGAAIPVLDFGAAEAVTPTTANITVTGAGGSDVLAETSSILTTASCVRNTLVTGALTAGQTVFPIYGIPASLGRSSDFTQVGVVDVAGNSTRSATVDYQTFGAQTIALPAALTGASVTDLSGAYKRLQATLTLPADYSTAALTYSGSNGNTLTILESAQYLGGSAATLTAPDLSSLPGFSTSWEPSSGTGSYTLTATNGFSGTCADQATTKFAAVTGTA
jgi:hypothetical protein